MHRLLSPFWNRNEGRIRAGWRLTIHLVCYFLAQLSPTFLIGDRHETGSSIAFGPVLITHRAIFIFLGMVAIVLTTWLIGVFIDRRPFARFGFRLDQRWWKDLGFGLFLGAFLMAGIFVAEWLFGWLEITDFYQVRQANISFGAAIISPILLFIAISIQEELLFRGYEIRNLAEGIHGWWFNKRTSTLVAWVLTSSLFGLYHFFNPNTTWISTLNIALAGIFLGLGYVLTGELALSIGLHLTWNLFQGNIFGFPVSGNEFDDVTLIAIQQNGPTLWTGGDFGPEAGLIGIIAMLIGTLLILGWLRWQQGEIGLYGPIAEYDMQRSLVERKVRGNA